MNKVLLKAPLLSCSGYGNHSRQIFEFLLELKHIDLDCEITNWGNTSWFLSNELVSNNVYSKIVERSKHYSDIEKTKYKTAFQVGYPSEWSKIGEYNIGVTAGVETSEVSLVWLKKLNEMDEVIFPSLFAMSAFKEASDKHELKIDTKCHVIPEYYHEEFDDNTLECKELQNVLGGIETKNNILLIGQLTSASAECDRKNIFNSIASLVKILSKVSSSSLVIKTSLSTHSNSDFIKLCHIFEKYVSIIKSEYKDNCPKIYLLHGNLSPRELKNLYESEKISLLASCTRGEGFGLTLLEAAACGLPIAATDHSAYLEFLKDDFIKVDCTEVLVPKEKIDGIVFCAGAKWAEYSEESLNDSVLSFFENPMKHIAKSKSLQKIIVNNYNKHSILNIYRDKLKKQV